MFDGCVNDFCFLVPDAFLSCKGEFVSAAADYYSFTDDVRGFSACLNLLLFLSDG